jgi:hypothetical protein
MKPGSQEIEELVSRPRLRWSAADYIRLGVALSLAAYTTDLVLTAGLYGAAGSWLLGTFVSTVLISVAGGQRRVLYTAVATVPPFILIYLNEVRLSFPNRVSLVLDEGVQTFAIVVALPLLIACIVARLTREKLPA